MASGAKVQRVKVGFGADGSYSDAASDNGLPVASGYKEFTGSASANNTDLVSQDVSLYRWVQVQFTTSSSCTVQFQGSNDNTNWLSVPLARPDSLSLSPTAVAISPTTGAIYAGPLNFRYFRARITSYSSGTCSVVAGFTANPSTMVAAAISSIGNSVSVFGTVTPTPGTSGGWSVSSQTALTNTKTQVKSSSGTVGGWMVYNPNATVAYVQVWDVASGSITVGTTAPTYVLSIPPGSAANLEMTCGIAHATAINIAATTTPTGSTAPSAALTVALFYK